MRQDSQRNKLEKYERQLNKSLWLGQPISEIQEVQDDIVNQISNYILSPCMAAFSLWLVKKARKDGVKRLYFLARDGYLMYQSAKFFCEKMKIEIDCRYLSCSRYSLRIPLFHMDTDEALEYICRSGIEVSIETIMNRTGLIAEKKEEIIRSLAMKLDLKAEISYAQLAVIKRELKGNDTFIRYMCEQSKIASPNLQGYLIQEGLLENDIEMAVVDSGWTGSMQKNLNQVLSSMGKTKGLTGYYWGLYELPTGVDRADYQCYYFEPERHFKEKVYFSNCLFEVVFSASHGMTLGYLKEENWYRAEYMSISDERKIFAEQIEKNLKKYLKSLSESGVDFRTVEFEKERVIIRKLLRLFMGKPTKEEAEYFGSRAFSDDVLDNEDKQLATLLNERELKENHFLNKMFVMLGLKKGKIKESAWYEGSVVRHGKKVKQHIFMYVLYKYLIYMRKAYLRR